MKQSEMPYRPNAGIIVFNAQGLVLAGERIDSPDCWQLPQGGIDDLETPLEAARRELYEETGLKIADPVFEIEDWICYDFTGHFTENLRGFRGQKQKWFLFFWNGNPLQLDPALFEQEFRQLAWKDFDFLITQIVDFKVEVYKTIQQKAQPLIQKFNHNNNHLHKCVNTK